MQALNKDNILKTLTAHYGQLQQFGVYKIGLFGSYLRHEADISSDIDLLVDIQKEKKTFRNFMGLCYFLEDLFHHKVDVVTTQSLSPYIGPHILSKIEYASFPDLVFQAYTQ